VRPAVERHATGSETPITIGIWKFSLMRCWPNPRGTAFTPEKFWVNEAAPKLDCTPVSKNPRMPDNAGGGLSPRSTGGPSGPSNSVA